MRRLLLPALLLSLGGCATHSDYYYDPSQDPGQTMGGQPTSSAADRQKTTPVEPRAKDEYLSARIPDSLPAVARLKSEAAEQQRLGHYDKALSTLERALRMQPRDADIYARMAQIYLQQERYSEAEQLARRGLTVATTSPERESLRRIITQSQRGAS